MSRRSTFFAFCLLLVVVSCLDGRSSDPESIGPSPAASSSAKAAAGSEQASLRKTPMPATLWMAFLRTQQKAAGYDFVSDAAGTLRARAGSHDATAAVVATPRGVRLSRNDGGELSLGVETRSVGRDGAARSRGVLRHRAEGQELVLDREDDVEERYLAGPLGLEQSFVVRARPEGQGPLAIEVAFDGLTPEAAGGAPLRVLLRDEAGRVRAGYRDLVAADAEGRELPARMLVREGGVALVIEDAGASYPLRVDPVVWTQQAELTAGDGAAGDQFGYSVSVSGGTAIVGAHTRYVGANARQGAAYIFVKSGATWTQQAELTASDGAASDRFGNSVSVSGGTAIVGALDHTVGANAQQGAAYIFVQSGGTWTQQAELTASDGAAGDEFGYSVSVSGGTAVVGAFNHTVGANAQQGAAYVFVQSGGTWTQQAELTASDGAASDLFGISVSVSGGSAIVGADNHVGTNAQQGAAYVFVQSGATWTQQAELTASDGAASDLFGVSVSVSGGTAIVGAYTHNVGANLRQGAAYVFVQSGATWTQQAELTASDGAGGDQFGYSVSVSGGTAVVGARFHKVGADKKQGAAYIFVQSGATWTQQAELTASDGAPFDFFGHSVSVSGSTAIVGAVNHQVGANAAQAAAYVFDTSGATSGCVIGGTSYAAGIANPTNACQVCAPASSTTAWSNAAGGTTCNDGNPLTKNDVCTGGGCAGVPLCAGVTCTASDECHVAGTCDPSTGACSNPTQPEGTACSNGTCEGGTCAAAMDGGTDGGSSGTSSSSSSSSGASSSSSSGSSSGASSSSSSGSSSDASSSSSSGSSSGASSSSSSGSSSDASSSSSSGSSSDASSSSSSGAGGASSSSNARGGCTCTTVGSDEPPSTPPAALAGLALAALTLARRRR
jgi:MYXO-CTERM domain-containing protein